MRPGWHIHLQIGESRISRVQQCVVQSSPLQPPLRTSTLAAKGLWNLVSRMWQDREFVQECLTLGVVGSLCGAARGATDLLGALDEVGGRSHRHCTTYQSVFLERARIS